MLHKDWVAQFFCLIVAILAAAVLFSHPSIAGDPPHNEASGIDCSDCHGENVFYSNDKSDSAFIAVCQNCHAEGLTVGYDTGNEYHSTVAPMVLSHAPGGSAIRCTVCHHNHDQDQIYNGKNEKSKFFIATGTVTDIPASFSYNSGTDRTTITYATLAATDNTSKWADLSFLAKKTGDGRGAMLVPNHTSRKRWPVYIIKSIDTNAKTITVKGKITSASSLGIFYGQSIRRSVNYEPVAGMPKSVKFYDRTGPNGLTNPYAPYNGICQVCHENQGATTGIKHWRNDGTGISHNTGSDCMGCHSHASGMHTNGSNHNGSGDCSDCHNDHHSSANASVGNCEYCHADPRGGMIYWDDLLPGDNGPNYGSFLPTQMACQECHVDFSGGNMTVTKFTRTDYTKYTVDYIKTTVHTIANSDLATLGQINNYGICLSCHNGQITTAVTVWHARPDKHHSSWVFGVSDDRRCTGDAGNPSGDPPPTPLSWAEHVAGRSSGTIGSFNLFRDPGFGYTPDPSWADPCTDRETYSTPDTASSFTQIAIPAVPGNGNTSGSVPVFASVCRKTPDGDVCGPSSPPPSDVTETFDYIGNSAQTHTIPANATDIWITVKGAGGGGGRPDNVNNATPGQAGSKLVIPYPNAGVTLTIYVGEGGKMALTDRFGADGGWGYLASGANGQTVEIYVDEWAYGGPGGGGASSVYIGGTKIGVARGGRGGNTSDYYYADEDVILAGGKGGAGGGTNYYFPSGTLNLTGGGSGGTTAPTDGGNGQVIITYNLL